MVDQRGGGSLLRPYCLNIDEVLAGAVCMIMGDIILDRVQVEVVYLA